MLFYECILELSAGRREGFKNLLHAVVRFGAVFPTELEISSNPPAGNGLRAADSALTFVSLWCIRSEDNDLE